MMLREGDGFMDLVTAFCPCLTSLLTCKSEAPRVRCDKKEDLEKGPCVLNRGRRASWRRWTWAEPSGSEPQQPGASGKQWVCTASLRFQRADPDSRVSDGYLGELWIVQAADAFLGAPSISLWVEKRAGGRDWLMRVTSDVSWPCPPILLGWASLCLPGPGDSNREWCTWLSRGDDTEIQSSGAPGWG